MGNEIILGHRIPYEDSSVKDDTYHIIYRMITMTWEEDRPKNGYTYYDVFYANDGEPMEYDYIEDFIDDVLQRGRPAPLVSTSPLDLNCKTDCYIVFQLDPKINWQFATSGDCFTTKKDMANKYYGLHHVMPNGVRIPGGEPIDEGCKLLYFRARCKNYKFEDGFNLVIDLRLDPVLKDELRRTKIVIDPDIRNPGGSSSRLAAKKAKPWKKDQEKPRKPTRKEMGKDRAIPA